MMRKIICIIAIWGLASCTNTSKPIKGNKTPDQTAWAIYHGEPKEDVLNFMKEQQLEVSMKDNNLIGFKLGGIIWMNNRWDMVDVKFDQNNKAVGLQLVRSLAFDESEYEEIVEVLESLYGPATHDSDYIWNFKGNDSITAFFVKYRPLIHVSWE